MRLPMPNPTDAVTPSASEGSRCRARHPSPRSFASLRMRWIVMVTLGVLINTAVASEEIPAPPQSKPIAIVGATVHPISGPDVEQATLIFENGKITAVGKDLSIPSSAEKIDGL